MERREVKAGETIRILVELRDREGRLVNGSRSSEAVEVKLVDKHLVEDYHWMRGKYFGTYLLTFTHSLAGKYNHTVQV